MFDKIEWVALRACIMIEQKNKCAMCGTILKDNEFTLHHIIPRAENGKNDIDNLIGLCNECHNVAEDEQLNREEIINHKGKYSLSKNKIKYIKKSYFVPEIDNQMKYKYPEEIILKDKDKYIVEKKHKEDINKEEEFYKKIVNVKYEYTPRELLLFFGLR